MLTINDVSLACLNAVAKQYHVPAVLVLSVLKTENGRNGMSRINTNGTYDLGVMQVNSVFLSQLKSHGYTLKRLQYSSCENITVATWILSKHIANSKASQIGIGNYHSVTPKLNAVYFNRVKENYKKIVQTIVF
ncbi:MAG TPA: lytic transglycosylase domain-containing protein [Gammaproteobacteria bacterium]|jgi:hypothetical protein|nr:lytic transglycosylase domain-containing protein [Gammaproteobacteria bacterium]